MLWRLEDWEFFSLNNDIILSVHILLCTGGIIRIIPPIFFFLRKTKAIDSKIDGGLYKKRKEKKGRYTDIL
jgi:hypothetical protein